MSKYRSIPKYPFRPSVTLILASLLVSCNGHMTHDDHQHDSGDGHHSEDLVGKPGLAHEVDRTVTVTMSDDMSFMPGNIDVKAGETIRFELANDGVLKHEMVIGKSEYLMEHAKMMQKFPGMEHEEPNMLQLDASESGELIWKFTESGNVDFACLQPGHFEAGMKGIIKVL